MYRHPGLDPGSRFFNHDRMESARHRSGGGSDFCARYALDRLVRAECGDDIMTCIEQEKRIKRWRRQWKLEFSPSLRAQRSNPRSARWIASLRSQ
jgi:predicted GIY-YIG superfamily endonuclease